MKSNLFLLVCILSMSIISSVAEARKFSFDTEFISSYFGGNFGVSQTSNSPYGKTSASNVTVDQQVATNTGAEFGVLLSFARLNLKLGGEVIIPKSVSGAKGVTSSSTEYFALESKSFGIMPVAVIELPVDKTSDSRSLIGIGFGWATVSLDNTYVMTAAGTAAFPGLTEFTESSKGTGGVYIAYFGYELLFTDTTTVFFNAGYRRGAVENFKATKAVNTMLGNISVDEQLLNNDQSARKLDLGGAFVGVSLRFYL